MIHIVPRSNDQRPSLRSAAFVSAVFVSLLSLPAAGQLAPSRAGSLQRPAETAAVVTASCSGGIVYDDGGFEDGIRFTDTTTGQGLQTDAVMRFDLPSARVRIDQVCICWRRGTGAPTTLDHGIVFFAADGPGGSPGTELAVVNATAEGIPVGGAIFGYDLTGQDIETTSSAIYVGARWNGRGGQLSNGLYLCDDENRAIAGQPMYVKLSNESTWLSFDDPTLFGGDPPQQKPDALGVRIDVTELIVPCPTTPCVDDDFTLCLNGDRFAVQASFDPPNDGDDVFEPAQRVELTIDTGYFWFFRDTNVEMVVKVLNGCGVNGHYWVFAGGLTNVAVEMEVCDTLAGLKRLYSNPQETPFQPIQDTGAFATCP